ncbi:hypothetical protein POSPLADRAFT_1047794 [Postia placenta MAD-698-R-SB12]|uniref:Uncharacterized protein n=1 Tax=Postia placenta MAD-698-R-SB12 TaxID=670580 RepID=A0A1X6MVC7_9APHY|nr:hypothetical protein POSPLADRAFT_1047794 [Postia placenta MAD-698-R-SB12]OSX60335.1 hypothetical protein POSPLADRAFT_1047794 [Postia placenta MAD-698-R-SB12]
MARYWQATWDVSAFVSSHKADVFKCHATNGGYMDSPYTCAYSHGAKRGGTPLLALATEQGAVHVVNTTKRRDWDYEPQRTIFSPHQNGVFAVRWSPSDTLLATASGDQSARISSLDASVSSENRTLHVLRGHGSTVKCIAWDPLKDGSVLATGGRDGGICVWDLRAGEGRSRRGSVLDGAPEPGAIAPIIVIPGAHGLDEKPTKPNGRKGKLTPAAPQRSITSLVYSDDSSPYLVSSGSYDGILRKWDLRMPTVSKKKSTKASKAPPKPVCSSGIDPTTVQGTRRARGITSLAPGHGPTAGLLFALGNDSRIHTYSLPSLEPLSGYATPPATEDPWAYSHVNMQTNSFYVHLALSPCGRWLANGNATDGRIYLFDVGSTASVGRAVEFGYDAQNMQAVELRGQAGETGALDWAHDMLATCADDTTVRIWRPDIDVYNRCMADSERMGWDWSWATKP